MNLGYDSSLGMDDVGNALRRYGVDPKTIDRNSWLRVLREYEKSGRIPQLTEKEQRAFDERFPDASRIKQL